jgi:hypothetical protein
VRDYRFWTWFARVRKYFVCNEKFRSEISRFRRACDSRRVRFREGVRVLKLEGFNLKVKLKLKCLKGVPEGGIPEGWSSRRWGGIRQVPKGKGSSIRSRVTLVVRRGYERAINSCSGGSQRVRRKSD